MQRSFEHTGLYVLSRGSTSHSINLDFYSRLFQQSTTNEKQGVSRIFISCSPSFCQIVFYIPNEYCLLNLFCDIKKTFLCKILCKNVYLLFLSQKDVYFKQEWRRKCNKILCKFTYKTISMETSLWVKVQESVAWRIFHNTLLLIYCRAL